MLGAASGMMFAAPAPLRAVQHLIPIPCPLFAPGEGLGAGLANLLRQQCLALLVALRVQVAVTRKQALAAYAMELQAVNLPGVALWVFVAGLSVPRRGWSKRYGPQTNVLLTAS